MDVLHCRSQLAVSFARCHGFRVSDRLDGVELTVHYQSNVTFNVKHKETCYLSLRKNLPVFSCTRLQSNAGHRRAYFVGFNLVRGETRSSNFKRTLRLCISVASVSESGEILQEQHDSRKREFKVLFAAGGTGGHVYPAIAIADAVHDICPKCSILFAGTRDKMEWKAVPSAGYDISPILAVQVQRPFKSIANILLPLKLVGALLVALRLLLTFQPHVVVGTGGYVSVPVCLVAWIFGCQIAILEPNAYPGLANRLIGLLASTVFVAFEESEKYFPAGRCKRMGTPTRATLQKLLPKSPALQSFLSRYDVEKEIMKSFLTNKNLVNDCDGDVQQKSDEEEVIVILGGSLGAGAINDAVTAAAIPLLEADSYRQIVWQTGSRYYDRVKESITPHPRLHVVPYVERMETVYGAADLVVARSGAITCSELLVTGTASILVPSRNVTDDHQRKNAEAMVACGASEMLLEESLSGESLHTAVSKLLGDRSKLKKMGENAKKSATPNAARDMAEEVLSLGKRNKWLLSIQRAIVTFMCLFSCFLVTLGMLSLSW